MLLVTAVSVSLAVLNAGPVALSAPPFVIFAVSLAFLGFVARPLHLVFTRHPKPFLQLREDVRSNVDWFVGFFVMLVALPLLFDSVTRMKQSIPAMQPFYADPFLIDLDHTLLAGNDAWELTHAVFGDWATRGIDMIYAGWLFVQVALTVLLALSRNPDFRIRVGLSMQLAWLLMGAGLAVTFASVGPCFVDDFYGSDRFATLMTRLDGYGSLVALDAMEYLLSVQGQMAIGGGISAMPSLHVGIAVLIWLCLRKYWPRWQYLGWAYVAAIYIGSIHLGWHYATDGLVSAAGMVLIWWAVGRYCRWLESFDRDAEQAAGAVA